MKRSEPSPETLRSSAHLRDRKPGEPPARGDDSPREGDEYRPQYLDLPPRRRGGAVRNVLLGTILVFVAAVLLSYAANLTGPRAAIPLAVALLTGLILFALARLRLFRQRNGGFLALGLICLLGAAIPLAEYALTRPASVGYEQPETLPAAPPAGKEPSAAEAQSLKEAFHLQPPNDDSAAFRVLQDLRVDINGKKYVIHTGDVFEVSEMTGEDVRFAAGGEQIALPLNMVEMLGTPKPTEKAAPTESSTAISPAVPPASANPANIAATPQKKGPVNITEEAQREAIRRYPKIGLRNSPENQLFIDSYQELKMSGADDFFANPEWPLALAEMLAKKQGWAQPGQPSSTSAQDGAGAADAGLPEEPRPKRRPVAEELDEPEPNAEAGEPATPAPPTPQVQPDREDLPVQ